VTTLFVLGVTILGFPVWYSVSKDTTGYLDLQLSDKFESLGGQSITKEAEYVEKASPTCPTSLQELLLSPEFTKEFMEFLSLEFCVENLLVSTVRFYADVVQFLLAIRQFKHNTEDNFNLVESATNICSKFVGSKSRTPVNLSGAVSTSILSQVISQEVSRDLFDDAEKQIYSLLKLDTFVRFRHTYSLG
jgi:hypothetical protein